MRTRIPSILVIMVGLFHILAITSNNFPEIDLPWGAEKIVKKYVDPIFDQNWEFFSPTPGFMAPKLWLRCEVNEKGWLPWMDPLEKLKKEHLATVVTGKGKLHSSYSRIAEDIEKEAMSSARRCKRKHKTDIKYKKYCKEYKVLRKVLLSDSYKVAKMLVRDICQSFESHNRKITAIQFKVISLWPKKFSDRFKDKKWGPVEEFRFPIEPLSLVSNK